MKTFFYVIIVAYNAGAGLLSTYESVCRQKYKNMLVLIQDGGSTDGSLERLREFIASRQAQNDRLGQTGGKREFLPRTAIVSKRDKGIYDAMNRAIDRALMDRNRRFAQAPPARYSERDKRPFSKRIIPDCYAIFMNCGDCFYHNDVLDLADERIREQKNHMSALAQVSAAAQTPGIFYGDTYDRKAQQVVTAAQIMDDFACYRSLPCHQSCFYNLHYLETEKYDLSFRVRADYEHFLRVKYKCHAATYYLNMVVADYEGGGFSETAENAASSEKERQDIAEMYLPRKKLMKYDLYRKLSLQPLRKKLAENERTAGLYHKVRTALQRKVR